MKAKTVQELKEQTDKKIKAHGWVAHYVLRGKYADIHTHGIMETYNRPELSITIPMHPDIANSIFWYFVNEYVVKGFSIPLDEKIKTDAFNIDFKATTLSNGNILIIIPDPQYLFPGDEGCEEIYSGQIFSFDDIDDETYVREYENMEDDSEQEKEPDTKTN